MFKFLKEKLKKSVSIFSKKIEDEGEQEEIAIDKTEETTEETKAKEVEPEEIKVEEIKPAETTKEELPPKTIEEETNKLESEEAVSSKPKKGFFKRFFSKDDSKDFDTGVKIEEKSTLEQEIPEDVKSDVEPLKEDVKEEIDTTPDIQASEQNIKDEKIVEDQELKDKLPEAKAEETKEEEIIKETIVEDTEKKETTEEETIPIDTKTTETKTEEVVTEETKEETKVKDTEEKVIEKKTVEVAKVEEEPKKSFFKKLTEKVTTTKIKESKFDELFWELEVALLENNVAVDVIDKIKNDLKHDIVNTPIKRGQVEDFILNSLKISIEELLHAEDICLFNKINQKKPFVICFVGINGSGKTTTIAKMAKLFLDKDKTVVLAAADTFRAAAIDQLGVHADNLGIKMIKHDYGSDPAAVAYDAIKYAKSKDIDIVLVDTAGRLHSNTNLVDEMKKIVRVSEPDLKIFVGESITGNDCVEQAVKFNEAINLDAIILSKADIDEKGGASISISYVTKKPIIYIGVGQEYSDLKPFNRSEILKNIGLSA